MDYSCAGRILVDPAAEYISAYMHIYAYRYAEISGSSHYTLLYICICIYAYIINVKKPVSQSESFLPLEIYISYGEFYIRSCIIYAWTLHTRAKFHYAVLGKFYM